VQVNRSTTRFNSDLVPNPMLLLTSSIAVRSNPVRHAWGFETYYRGKRWFFGQEYWCVFVSSNTKSNPRFHGGQVIMSYLFNDATRPYDTAGGYFRALVPKRNVFEGGPAAWELVLRYTHGAISTIRPCKEERSADSRRR
jgi:phosphate-selective porin